ncbi:hypothetical protein D3C87_1611440 [compost metagenome]
MTVMGGALYLAKVYKLPISNRQGQGGNAMTYQFSIYSRAEAMLLLELAHEHKSEVVTRCRETNFFTEISVHPECVQLQEYFDYMLHRLRDRQRQFEALYRRSPSEKPVATPASSTPDPYRAWQNHVVL